jgi:hypothetical protein
MARREHAALMFFVAFRYPIEECELVADAVDRAVGKEADPVSWGIAHKSWIILTKLNARELLDKLSPTLSAFEIADYWVIEPKAGNVASRDGSNGPLNFRINNWGLKIREGLDPENPRYGKTAALRRKRSGLKAPKDVVVERRRKKPKPPSDRT